MSNPDRGAYTPPTDAPLSFDARQPVRGARPAPMMLIVSALVLVVLVVAIVIFYRSGVHEANGLPPLHRVAQAKIHAELIISPATYETEVEFRPDYTQAENQLDLILAP